MAEQETGQERTEQPTPRRLDEAKRKGQIPRSREFNTMAIVSLAAAGLLVMGDDISQGLIQLMTQGLTPERADIFDRESIVRLLLEAIKNALFIIAPFLGMLLVASLLAPTVIGGWSFSWEALQPKLDKLNPIKGLKRVFSAKGLMELLKAMVKFLLVSAVAVTVLWIQGEEYLALGHEAIKPSMTHAGELFAWGFLYLSIALIVIAAIDVPFQIWDHHRQMRMTLQEIKDEYKESEGRPEVKSKVRQLQREMSERRMMEDVPKADVIVTNPTHFAVALKYDQQNDKAPVVLAKGADLIAMQIRTVGRQHDVTLVEAPPLARALFYNAEIGDEIPEGLYLAVAQILAYVYHLKTARQQGQDEPTQPDTVNTLPEEYQQYNDDQFNGRPH